MAYSFYIPLIPIQQDKNLNETLLGHLGLLPALDLSRIYFATFFFFLNQRLLGTCLKFNGQVDLKKPDHSFHLLEYYGHEGTPPPEQPLFLYFGRWVSHSL